MDMLQMRRSMENVGAIGLFCPIRGRPNVPIPLLTGPNHPTTASRSTPRRTTVRRFRPMQTGRWGAGYYLTAACVDRERLEGNEVGLKPI